MNLVVTLACIAVAFVAGFVIARARRAPAAPPSPSAPLAPAIAHPEPAAPAAPVAPAAPAAAGPDDAALHTALAEEARLVRSYEAEAAALRRAIAGRDAALAQLAAFAAERRRLFDDLAQARGETARYRQLVVDLENNAPPPLLDGPGAPDDLKLIVGVGPVLERMLHQLGVTTYRQIARWTERDVVEFDARLHEFPGRIRRDGWVTQARELHQSKYGEALPPRERG
jgi:predicted flap endonuclease-1-like 5' DNA nuclease